MKKFYTKACKEVDVKEVSGAFHNSRIIEYHATTTLKASDDETPWCSSFVNFIVEACGEKGTKSAAARSWLDWGRPISLADAKQGDIVIFSRGSSRTSGHVAFYSGVELALHIQVLGGNQDNKVGSELYKIRSILGIRRSENEE